MNEPFIGYYKLTQPAILLRDVDLIKKVFVDNFNNFSENECNLGGESDSLMNMHPYFHSDEKWEETRKPLSPVFASEKVIKNYKNYIQKFSLNF